MVNIEATQVFHGPEFMENKNADNLVFKNNPCHEFALEVAKRTRIDFSVNVVLNGRRQALVEFFSRGNWKKLMS